MALKVGKIVGGGHALDPFSELALGQRCEGLSAVDLVRLTLAGGRLVVPWHVDTQMIFGSVPRVSWSGLSGPRG
jgi:hypothetical protein